MPNSPRHFLSIALTLSVIWSTSIMGEDRGLFTGEVVDAKCYLASDASSSKCGDATVVKNGQPMGLLTDDGTLVLLAAGKGENKAYETLVARFGNGFEFSARWQNATG